MPSPFPGMNPYMEDRATWSSVHHHMLSNFAQQLAPQVRPYYRVHTERYTTIEDVPRKFRPDLYIKRRNVPLGKVSAPSATATEATLTTENIVDYEEEDTPPHLEIISAEGEVITVIELLSYSNKETEYKVYIDKRYKLLKAGINLLEIDLLRVGKRVPLADELNVPYLCVLSRAHEWPESHLWGVTWAEPCPVLPVPLRPDEPEVLLKINPAIDYAYSIEFEDFIDYTADPPGKLTPEWQQEIDTILRAANLRSPV